MLNMYTIGTFFIGVGVLIHVTSIIDVSFHIYIYFTTILTQSFNLSQSRRVRTWVRFTLNG